MEDKVKEFIEKASPEYWYAYAAELTETANDIFKREKNQLILYSIENPKGEELTYTRPFASRPVLLLYGLAIENMLKALMISEKPSLLNDGKLHKHLLGHDLVKLSRNLTKISFTHPEIDLLSFLSDVVPYHGRYPVPRESTSLKDEKYLNEDIFDQCKAIYEKLELILYKLNYKGIKGPNGIQFSQLRLPHLNSKVDFIPDDDLKIMSEAESQFFRRFKKTAAPKK